MADLYTRVREIYPEEPEAEVQTGLQNLQKMMPQASDDELVMKAQELKEQRDSGQLQKSMVKNRLVQKHGLADKYSPEARQKLVEESRPSGGVEWGAVLSGLGAGLQGRDVQKAMQSNRALGKDIREQKLREFDSGKKLAEEERAKKEEEAQNDPESIQSKLMQRLASNLIPDFDFSGMGEKQIKELIPTLTKVTSAERKEMNKAMRDQMALTDQRLKLAEFDLKKRADERAETKAQRDEEKYESQEKERDDAVSRAGSMVIRDVNEGIELLNESPAVAGIPGILMKNIPSTDAERLETIINSVQGNIAVDQLLKIKKQGAGLGQVPQSQLEMLASLLGPLKQSNDPERLKGDLKRIGEIYEDIVKKAGGDPFEAARESGFDPEKGEWGSKEKKQKTQSKNMQFPVKVKKGDKGTIINNEEELQEAFDDGWEVF